MSVSASLFGMDVRFESNHSSVLALAHEMLRDFRGTLIEHATDPLVVHIRIEQRDDKAGDRDVQYSKDHDGRLILHGASVSGVVDPSRREARAVVSQSMLEDTEQFRDQVLEALTQALVSHFDRHPVHAAAIEHRGRAVLLAAPSGTGKSTLAQLAHRSGFHMLGDECVRVQMTPTLRVWGGPARIRLLTGSGAKRMHAVSPSGSPFVDRAVVCILASGTEVRRQPLSASDISDHLDRQLAPGYDRFPERWPAVRDALSAGGGWLLTLSQDPEDALPVLRDILEEPEE